MPLKIQPELLYCVNELHPSARHPRQLPHEQKQAGNGTATGWIVCSLCADEFRKQINRSSQVESYLLNREPNVKLPLYLVVNKENMASASKDCRVIAPPSCLKKTTTYLQVSGWHVAGYE